MLRISVRLAFVTASLIALPAVAAMADDSQIARGRYLVALGGCNDCHTPGYFLGNPDMSRFLGGSDVGFEIPGQVSLWAQSSHPTKRPASVVGPRADREGDTGW
jgi:mono/diheme cytochrome c family protein